MQSILERSITNGTPLIDGSSATFVWRGSDDIPQLTGDFNNWEDGLVLTEAEPNVWTHTHRRIPLEVCPSGIRL